VVLALGFTLVYSRLRVGGSAVFLRERREWAQFGTLRLASKCEIGGFLRLAAAIAMRRLSLLKACGHPAMRDAWSSSVVSSAVLRQRVIRRAGAGDRDVERDVERHDLRCQKFLCGRGVESVRGRRRASDGGPPWAQDAGLPGMALLRQRVVRSDDGDRQPQAALRRCPYWAAGQGAAPARPCPGTGAFAIGDSRRSRTSRFGTGAARRGR